MKLITNNFTHFLIHYQNDYKTNNIVTWMIGDKLPHIGIVTHINSENGNPMIVHKVGSGQVLEDCLLCWEIVGHY